MKTSELTGPALDWAVAKCEGENLQLFIFNDETLGDWCYSTDWSQGGPIIEREGVELKKWGLINRRAILETNDVRQEANGSIMLFGPTPLIAAMRCYVASKLGDEVETPERLK